jgi:hypothetical protein
MTRKALRVKQQKPVVLVGTTESSVCVGSASGNWRMRGRSPALRKRVGKFYER